MLTVGETLDFDSPAIGAPAAVARAGTKTFKRGVLQVFDALMPRGQ
jgi:hypothetical protein